MKSRTALRAHVSAIWLAMLVAGGLSARAAVIDYRAEVYKMTDLIHHYTFETHRADLDAPRIVDRAGIADLAARAGTAGSAALPPLSFEAGYDALSTAGMSVYSNNSYTIGRAWVTTNAITLPSAFTVECLVSAYQIPTNNGAGVITSRPADSQRGYYLWLTPSGGFETRVGGAAARTIVASVHTGHWYYVASTYAVSAGQTTINSYYADLTANGPLLQAITNFVVNGTYGSSGRLGVGGLHNIDGALQYMAPCLIDEVALFDTVHSHEAVSNRWEQLKRATPTVEYREIFPNDTGPERPVTQEGWVKYHGTNALANANIVIPFFNTAFDADIAPVASFPGDFGVTNGYLNNHGGQTNINYFYWTEEMDEPLDVGWIKRVDFDTRTDLDYILRLALRVDTNDTPAATADDVWFVSADFLKPPGTSAFAIPVSYSAWRRWFFDVGAAEWAVLDFVPGSRNYLGETQATLPTNGLVTAFGLFQDSHNYGRNMRIDNFTVYARRIYPPPPPSGTVITLQ